MQTRELHATITTKMFGGVTHVVIVLQKVECTWTYRKWLPTNKSKVMKILLVKDHTRNGKEPFCVKPLRVLVPLWC